MESNFTMLDLLALADLEFCPFSGKQELKDLIDEFNGDCKIIYSNVNWCSPLEQLPLKIIRPLPYDLNHLHELKKEDLKNVKIFLVDLDAINKDIYNNYLINIPRYLSQQNDYITVQLSEKSTTKPLLDIFNPLLVLLAGPVCSTKKEFKDALSEIVQLDQIKTACEIQNRFSQHKNGLEDIRNRSEDFIETVESTLNLVKSMKFSPEEREAFASAVVAKLPDKLPSREKIKNSVENAAKETIAEEARNAILKFDENAVQKIAKKTIDSGIFPIEIIETSFIDAMSEIDRRYKAGEISNSQLQAACRAHVAGINALEPITVILGTTEDNKHPIRIDKMTDMLQSVGYKVFNLGNIQVPNFVEKAKESKANIIAFHTLRSTNTESLHDVVESLQKENIRDNFTVMVFGELADRKANEIGAEIYAKNESDALNKLNVNISGNFNIKGKL